MRVNPFLLERHFALYEFEVPYQLSCSDCEPLTMKELLGLASPDMIRMWEQLRFTYTNCAGHPLLRNEISGLYTGIRPEEVIVCVPEEGIFLAMNALLDPGDHVVVISPAYQSLHEIASAIGCTVTGWNSDEDGRYHPEELRSLVNPATRMVVINFPHNPSGAQISEKELETIAGFCDSAGIILFSDEMYRGLEQDPSRRLPGAACLGERCISLGGMSKVWSLPGLRIGWLACRSSDLRKRIITLKDYTTICSSAPSEILSVIALQSGSTISDRNLSIIRHNIKLVNDLAGRHSGRVSWRPPEAGSVALLGLRGIESVTGFCDGLLREKEVLAIGSHLFGPGQPAIRLGLGRNDFGEAIKRLNEYLM